MADFHPTCAQDIVDRMTVGFEGSAAYRMVTTYWEMAAALVNRGALDESLFQDANTEHVVVMAKLHPFLAEVRARFREPGYLRQLEDVVMRLPEAEALMARRRHLCGLWRERTGAAPA